MSSPTPTSRAPPPPCSRVFVIALDAPIVNVALPQIHSSLGGESSGIQ
jgi:hypothetical protein